MNEKNDLIKVGKYDLRYNELLSIDIEELDIDNKHSYFWGRKWFPTHSEKSTWDDGYTAHPKVIMLFIFDY